jgi:hypothetical protein
MGHIDWLVDRGGVMFAPDTPRSPEDDAGEADNSKRNPGETNRTDKSDRDPEEIEVGDPRDGP